MLVVKNIEIIDVGYRDRVELDIFRGQAPYLRAYSMDGKKGLCDAKIVSEAIHGVEFVSPIHGSFWVGWSNQVEKTLGIPLKIINDYQGVISSQDQEICKIKSENIKLSQTLGKFLDMSFWERLMFLFKGDIAI